MASQLQRVTRNPRMRESQVASMNARLDTLPEMLRRRERAADLELQSRQFNQSMKMQNKARQVQQRAAEAAFGLEAAKLGMTAATSGVGQKTLGGLFGSKSGGPFSNITTGSIVGGGLAGFGAGKLAGGKSKTKKALFGAGAGGLMSLLGGGANMANIGSGVLSGAIGGMLG